MTNDPARAGKLKVLTVSIEVAESILADIDAIEKPTPYDKARRYDWQQRLWKAQKTLEGMYLP